jgi:hypothetical protein
MGIRAGSLTGVLAESDFVVRTGSFFFLKL